jgi:hypothetical protein
MGASQLGEQDGTNATKLAKLVHHAQLFKTERECR